MNSTERKKLIFNYLKRNDATPKKITDIFEYITELGGRVTRKTIVRDLEEFENDIDINIIKIGERPARYSLEKGSTFSHRLKIENEEVETILLGLSLLESSAPKPLAKRAKKSIDKLISVLDEKGSKTYSNFIKKNRFCDSSIGRSTVRSEKAFNNLLKSLNENKVVKVKYINSKDEEKERVLTPLVFFMSGPTPYIYSFDHSLQKLRVFKAARFLEVKSLDIERFVPTKSHTIRIYRDVENSFSGYIEEETEEVSTIIIGDEKTYNHFLEKEYHKSQKLEFKRNVAKVSFIRNKNSRFEKQFKEGLLGISKIIHKKV